MADDLTAILAAIRDRAGVFAKFGPPRPALGFGSEVYNAAIASAEDASSLVAAVEAVLKAADSARARQQVYLPGSVTQPISWDLDPAKIREAIRAALAGTGKEGGEDE